MLNNKPNVAIVINGMNKELNWINIKFITLLLY
jgi:hypothetical protein